MNRVKIDVDIGCRIGGAKQDSLGMMQRNVETKTCPRVTGRDSANDKARELFSPVGDAYVKHHYVAAVGHRCLQQQCQIVFTRRQYQWTGWSHQEKRTLHGSQTGWRTASESIEDMSERPRPTIGPFQASRAKDSRLVQPPMLELRPVWTEVCLPKDKPRRAAVSQGVLD